MTEAELNFYHEFHVLVEEIKKMTEELKKIKTELADIRSELTIKRNNDYYREL